MFPFGELARVTGAISASIGDDPLPVTVGGAALKTALVIVG
jgi:hypothetical protein